MQKCRVFVAFQSAKQIVQNLKTRDQLLKCRVILLGGENRNRV